MDTEITTLSKSLLYEIVGSLGLPRDRFHHLFWPAFRGVTDRLASIGVAFDRMVAEAGFPKAAEWALTHWCTSVSARGAENAPAEGPLLVVSNHPGTYDSLIVASQLGRKDICYITGDIPFLKHMPHAHTHFFFISDDPYERMVAARKAIRHLQGGGSLLLFGAGHIDPDPSVYGLQAAFDHIQSWFASIDLFLRRVPDARILLSMVSGVISPRWAWHPVTWLRRMAVDKQRLAEFGQVIQQLLFPGKLMFTPRVSFARPVTMDELRRESNPEDLMPSVVRRAQSLLVEHMAWTSQNATVSRT